MLSQVDQIEHLRFDLNWSMRKPVYSKFFQDYPETEARYTMDLAEADMVLLAQPFPMLRNVQKMEIRLGGEVDEQGWSFHPDLQMHKSNLESVVMSKEPSTENEIQQVQEFSYRMLEKLPPPGGCYDKQMASGRLPDTWECPWTNNGRRDGKVWAVRSVIVQCGLPSCHGHEFETWRLGKEGDEGTREVPEGPGGIWSEKGE
ncbi:hypothetical protein MMC30_003166 [Trapelia coarctata]|nr:hypothetical protein [Trapelia coarctata]